MEQKVSGSQCGSFTAAMYINVLFDGAASAASNQEVRGPASGSDRFLYVPIEKCHIYIVKSC